MISSKKPDMVRLRVVVEDDEEEEEEETDPVSDGRGQTDKQN
jgi:hypothetical protein